MIDDRLNKFAFIDALRGYAILGVLFVHVCQRFAHLPAWVATLSVQGQRGVQLFYMVSALTLFLSMDKRFFQERCPIANYFIRRFFRIAPLFYLSIILYSLVYGDGPRYFAPDGIDLKDILLTVFFINGWYPTSINSVIPGGWSIAVEMVFYIFVPFLFQKIRNIKTAFLWLTFSIVFSIAINLIAKSFFIKSFPSEQFYLVDWFLYFWLPSQVPIFFLGIILFFAIKENQTPDSENNRSRSIVVSVLVIIFLVIVAFIGSSFVPVHFVYGIGFGLFGYSLYIYSNPLFVNRFISYAGKVSFSIYILHWIVLDQTMKVLKEYLILFPNQFPQPVIFLVFILITMALIFLVSSISHFCIEIPGIRLGQMLIEKTELRALTQIKKGRERASNAELLG